MSEKIFDDLRIRKPDIHLETGPGSHAKQTGEMMIKLEEAMIEKKPDVVIVFGDTNSTLAGVLAASKLNIPIVHIEAGLRSYNRAMPEEINRITADHLSHYLFAPTQNAVKILKNEGQKKHTFFTGDIMVDTMKNNIDIAIAKSNIISVLLLENKIYHLLTLHRNYNVDNKQVLEYILDQLGKLEDQIIFPIHPRTRKMLTTNFIVPQNIRIVEPLGYLDFITLENFANKIITDSGGIQKESYILRKPCVTLRTETEWTETVEEKWNLLINPRDKKMAEKIVEFKQPNTQKEIFGKKVTGKMVKIIDEIC